MAILKNTTIQGTGNLTLPVGTDTDKQNRLSSVIESFTTVGTTTWTAPAGVNQVEVLVVAGGGGGGNSGGGGGAGGLIYRRDYLITPGTSYTVIVGGGGTGAAIGTRAQGSNGGNSVFGDLTAIGGGGGGSTIQTPGNGGSGGGAGRDAAGIGGSATVGQGNIGGQARTSAAQAAGGGGGAGGPGANGRISDTNTDSQYGGGGGNGLQINITNIPTWYAGGGGGGQFAGGVLAKGGLGGGGSGGSGGAGGLGGTAGSNGVANTGGGGGGGGGSNVGTANPGGQGGNGGSGVVILRYNLNTADNNDNAIRYSAEVNSIETYQDNFIGWVSNNPNRNYAGHNLLVRSEELGNAVYAKARSSVVSNAILAPNNTLTADKLVEDTSNGSHYINSPYVASTILPTGSAFVKAGERTFCTFQMIRNSGADFAAISNMNIDLSTGAFTGGAGASPSVTNVGNGWYRISLKATTAGSNYAVRIGIGAPSGSYLGDNTSGIFIWGMQLESADSAGPYVKTLDVISPTPSLLNGYRIHTYTTTGTSGFTPLHSGIVEVLVVAGGGGGGGARSGGGGAGGVIYEKAYPVIGNTPYEVTVGAGGTGGPTTSPGIATNGQDSVFATLRAIGGGRGGSGDAGAGVNSPGAGGSGGGGTLYYPAVNTTLPGNPGGAGVNGQGFSGGNGFASAGDPGGGGGGAGGKGGDFIGTNDGGPGGPGVMSIISGSQRYYGGGGGGGTYQAAYPGGAGGIGGGGRGSPGASSAAGNGTANTGGGGGGGGTGAEGAGKSAGGNGGSGIVIVRYRNEK
jgi:hypothetical protein